MHFSPRKRHMCRFWTGTHQVHIKLYPKNTICRSESKMSYFEKIGIPPLQYLAHTQNEPSPLKKRQSLSLPCNGDHLTNQGSIAPAVRQTPLQELSHPKGPSVKFCKPPHTRSSVSLVKNTAQCIFLHENATCADFGPELTKYTSNSTQKTQFVGPNRK